MTDTTIHQQALGFSMENWSSRILPDIDIIEGNYCILKRVNQKLHSKELYTAFQQDSSEQIWTYLPYGPFKNFEEFDLWLQKQEQSTDPIFYTILNIETRKSVGYISLMRIQPQHGVLEIGHVVFSPELQKTTAATEVIYMLLNYAFTELGYRRVEWKCDALNEKSNKAALRFGFTFEGIFRQALVYKNRNRDTAWYSIIDTEWPSIKPIYQDWFSPNNFDHNGNQVKPLEIQNR